MLQRDTHVSASDNSNSTTYTLYVKNKTYNGWDGNSIGFEGSASIVSNVSTSINEAWNKFGTGSADGVYLGGFVSGSNVGGVVLNENGKIFSGSLQEFRYYSVDLSESIFNDFVMNPESIEGVNLTGSLSSFDVLNFRAPLGNEMESIFTASYSSSYSESMVSMHPAITGAADLLITGSFVNPSGNVTSSTYDILYYENTTTKTYSKTNTEVYFLDQPAIGIRNRISNKIEIDNAQDYGTTLSSLRSIQQDYQISRSYTEDINNLEVAFSPQDEVNDDIIQTFGFGVVADALADPRFVSSSDDYYPKLRKTAEDYFEKYTKGNVYDYLRLIKYFDNSIFKAIKNYVPARTSVSTGIVIKQHLLERNRVKPPQLSEVTTIARYASGSVDNISWNQPLNYENLELTSSIGVGGITGSTGGSPEQFNYSGSPVFGQLPITQSWDNNIPTELGLTTIVENKEREFYDGEYSGSEKAATTQSLFNNPFKIFSPTETTYNIQVTESGFYDYQTVGSGGIPMVISKSAAGVYPSIDQLQSESANIGSETGSIIHMCPHPSSSAIWYITAIVLAKDAYWDDGTGSGSQYSGTWPTLFLDHFEGQNTVYPYWARNGVYYSGVDSFIVTPYFRFSLPSPTTGSYNTGSDVYSGNLPWSEIYPMGLGFLHSGGILNGRWWSRFKAGAVSNAFPVLLNGLNAATFTTSSFNAENPNPIVTLFIGASHGKDAEFVVNVSSSTSLEIGNPIFVSSGGAGFVHSQTITIPSASLGATSGGGTDLIITLDTGSFDNTNSSVPLKTGLLQNFTTNSFNLPGVTPGTYPQNPINPTFKVPAPSLSGANGETSTGIGTTSGYGGTFNIDYDGSVNPNTIRSLSVATNGEGYADGDVLLLPTQSLGATSGGGTDLLITLSLDIYDVAISSSGLAGRPIVGSDSNFGFDNYTHFKSGLKYLSPASTAANALNNASSSVMSVNLQATSIWQSESADLGQQWQAHSIIVSQIDLNGNYNFPTLNNNPSFSLTLTDNNTTPTSSQNVLDKNAYILETLNYNRASGSFKFLFGFNNLQNIKASTQVTRVDDTNPLVISFNPYIDPSTINFQNSDYYATLNNFNDNRQNSFIMNLEYENGITTPSNLDLIISGTAEHTQTPDSNYTMRKVIRPRYDGVKLQSADYNFYTDGDISYGKTAAIDSNPIYFAHFKSSK
jgi:hypothetical protein